MKNIFNPILVWVNLDQYENIKKMRDIIKDKTGIYLIRNLINNK
jgi:group I intron endonuclease